MKGLIKKDLMTSKVKIWHFMIIMQSIYCLFLFTSIDDEWLPLLGISLLLLAPIVYFFNLYNYTTLDNYKSEIMLPIKIYNVVLSRYVVYFSIVLINLIAIILLIFSKFKLGIITMPMPLVNSIVFGACMTLIFGAILLFFVFLFGQNKVKQISGTSGVFTLILGRIMLELVVNILNLNNIGSVYEYTTIIMVYFLFSLLFYIFFCLISIVVLKNKEF